MCIIGTCVSFSLILNCWAVLFSDKGNICQCFYLALKLKCIFQKLCLPGSLFGVGFITGPLSFTYAALGSAPRGGLAICTFWRITNWPVVQDGWWPPRMHHVIFFSFFNIVVSDSCTYATEGSNANSWFLNAKLTPKKKQDQKYKALVTRAWAVWASDGNSLHQLPWLQLMRQCPSKQYGYKSKEKERKGWGWKCKQEKAWIPRELTVTVVKPAMVTFPDGERPMWGLESWAGGSSTGKYRAGYGTQHQVAPFHPSSTCCSCMHKINQ